MTQHRHRFDRTPPTGHSACAHRASLAMPWVCGWLAAVVALGTEPVRAAEDPIDVPVTRGKVDLGGIKPALPTLPSAGTAAPSATTPPPSSLPTKPRPRTVADYAAEAKAKAAAEAATKSTATPPPLPPAPPLLAPVATPATAPTAEPPAPAPAPMPPPKVSGKPTEKAPVKPAPLRPAAKPALDEGLDKVAIKLMEAMARASAKQDQRETTRPKSAKNTPTETVLSEKPQPQPSAPWGYEGPGGPENWGQLKPEFNTCAVGQRQSPIAIDGATTLQGPAEPLGFDYRPSEGSVVHNGHTIQVDLAPSTNTLSVRGSHYQLQQLLFHHPGETTVNGTTFAMSAHLVHQNAEGQQAVVALLLAPGETNPAVDTVWKYMPVDRGDRVKLPAGALNLPDLLPKDRRYYQFMGSLTTPPCTEGVLWMVLKTPVTLSPAQIRLFGQLFPHNARPVQPVNGRPVREAL